MAQIKSFSFFAVSLIASSMIFSSCGTSSEPEEPLLNQAVSMEIFSYLMTELMMIPLIPESQLALTTGMQLSNSESSILPDNYSVSAPCSQGGNMALTGSTTPNLSDEGTGTIQTSLVQTISNCGIATSQGVFVVNGNPNLSSSGNMTVQNWNPMTFTFSYNGGYRWEGIGQTGSCDIQINYSMDLQNPGSFSMSGHMCGYTY
ncbi:MAG: hypothetical protein JJU37_06210 [Balneolaceae bacterium]|nr:hypothetical protein [Balneolaceae bacterium]